MFFGEAADLNQIGIWWVSFKQFCTDYFESRSRAYFRNLPFHFSPISTLPGHANVPKPWNTVVLISGPEIQLQLQIFFSLADVSKTTQNVFDTVQNRDRDYCIDFIEEWANQIGGGLKSQLLLSGLALGHSLPISYRAYCNILHESSYLFDQSWILDCQEIGLFYIRLSLESAQISLLDHRWQTAFKIIDSAEVEFL